MEIKAPRTDSSLPVGGMSPRGWMDPVLWEDATQGGSRLGDVGYGEGIGSQEDSGGPMPKSVLHGPNTTPQKYSFQGQKTPVCSRRGFLAVPWVPDGSWTRRSVDGSLSKATVI